MDAEAILERCRILAEVDGVGALLQLLGSPTVTTLATASIISRLPLDPTAQRLTLRAFFAKVKPREVDEISVYETELDPAIASALGEAGIDSLGRIRRMSDEELVAIYNMTPARVEELRKVQRKYSGLTSDGAAGGAGKKQKRTDQDLAADVHAAIARGISRGEICRKFKLSGMSYAQYLRRYREQGAR
jgi:hypothetical protein